MTADAWAARIGQIQTVLTYFSDTCSVSVERADGATVYVQAQRADGSLDLEATGNTYLPPSGQLSVDDRDAMVHLGWTAPEPPETPNFTRLARPGADLADLAVDLAATFRDVFRVAVTDTWLVYPPELGVGSDLEPLEVLDLSKDDEPASASLGGESAMDGFSPYVQEHIGWYVYLLRDPRDNVAFYVGKGKGNRVFAHAQDAIALGQETATGLKLARIRDIHETGLQVQTEIIRHHISTEALAYTVEAAVIDTFRAMGQPLTNIVRGHRHELYGWASTRTVASIYDAPRLPETGDPIVLLKIPQLWTPAMSETELFGATRGWWKVGARALGARYALAVSKGVTRAAYRIEYWRERVPTDRDYSENDRGKRLGFWGYPAPEMADLVNRSVKHLPQSSGGSFLYLNVPDRQAPCVPLHRGDDALAKAEEEPSR